MIKIIWLCFFVDTVQGVSEKNSVPKFFWNIATLVKCFCVKFYRFVFIDLSFFSSNGNFSTSTHRFHLVEF